MVGVAKKRRTTVEDRIREGLGLALPFMDFITRASYFNDESIKVAIEELRDLLFDTMEAENLDEEQLIRAGLRYLRNSMGKR